MSSLNLIDPISRGVLKSHAWTLVIGAGVSRGLVPTWFDLTRELVNDAFRANYTEAAFRKLITTVGWSFDSWIQACMNEYARQGKTRAKFFDLLESKLYGSLRADAAAQGLEPQLVRALNDPRAISSDETKNMASYLETHYGTSTVFALVRAFLSASVQDRLPNAVITFNADNLFHTIFELFQRRQHYAGPPPHSHPKYYFKTVLRGIDGVPEEKTPIFHCHGAIKPRGPFRRSALPDSRDKLVFLEEEYLTVATTTSSWQENVFMHFAHSSSMVFLGLSMSDPNIRRWLSIAHKAYVSDLITRHHNDPYATRHLWICERPSDPNEVPLMEMGLLHLGVRVGWIKSWAETEVALRNAMALK